MSSSKWLIIPMEIVERELLGNILLALEGLQDGWQCVIGTKQTIVENIDSLPQGVVLMKSIVSSDVHNMSKFKNAGNKIASLDVEGLVYTSLDGFVTVRFSDATVDLADQIMFWGDAQKQALKGKYPHHEGKMVTTGSPIADFWQQKSLHAFFDPKVQEIKKRFEKYIIIPSSFASVNHVMGHEANLKIMQTGKMVAENQQEEFYSFWRDYEGHVAKIFESFLLLLPELSKAFPDHKIIVRPHPTENHATWKNAAQNLNNVEVLFEDVVSPWLLGADAVLHWGCTTGIEAALMGKPVISYDAGLEESGGEYNHKLPDSVSHIAQTPQEVVASIQKFINNENAWSQKFATLYDKSQSFSIRDWICNPEDSSCAQKIINQLNQIDTDKQKFSANDFSKSKPSLKSIVLKVLDQLYSFKVLRPVLPEKWKSNLESRAYGRQKTKDIDDKKIKASIATLTKVKKMQAAYPVKLCKNLYIIKSVSDV